MSYSKDQPNIEDRVESIQKELQNLCQTVERLRKEKRENKEKQENNISYRETFLSSVKFD